MFEWVLVGAVVAEGGEAEEDADVFGVGVIDEVADEIVLDVGVVGVVFPGDGELFGAEAAGGPEDEGVDVVFGEAVDGLFPLGEAHDGHAHEGDVVAALGEGVGGWRGGEA